MKTNSNPDVTLSIAQATSDTRHGIVQMVKRMIAANKRRGYLSTEFISGLDIITKIMKMDERAKLKPGGEGQRRLR